MMFCVLLVSVAGAAARAGPKARAKRGPRRRGGAQRSRLDPETGELLPAWDDALDAIGPHDDPWHVARFGARFDAQGVLAGSKDAGRCIGYLTKYLTKQLGDCHHPETPALQMHVDRLTEALRFEPCSPTCANWLRYGIQPKHPRPGLVPGRCKGKAHRRDHLGYAGQRALVSRKWSGKTLADHRGDRKAWLTEMLGLPATDPARYRWEQVQPGERGIASLPVVFAIADALPVRYRVMALPATFAGMRWGELVGLRRENIDLAAREIRIIETTAEPQSTA